MRKTIAWLLPTLCCLALAAPAPVEAACRKEILVYLDISGSMRPLDRDPTTSPFTRTVEALRELLAQPGLVQPDDIVQLRLFGERIESRDSARGISEIRDMIEGLLANERVSSLSNILLVIEDVVKVLATDESGFDRRLVIIASDFVHEPEPRKDANTYIAHWNEGIENLGDSVLNVLKADEKQAFLFPALPAYTSSLSPVRTAVLATLTSRIQNAEVDLVSSTPNKIAEEIHKKLLFAPDIAARVENGTKPSLKVRVTNRNCTSVSLTQVSARCRGQGDPVPLSLSSELPVELEATGLEGSFQDLEEELTRLSCEIGDDIEVSILLEEGISAKARISATDKLEVRPTQAGVAENSLVRDSLVLYLDLRGQVLTGRTYEFKLTRRSGDDTVAAGSFEIPQDLSAEWQTYRLPVRGPENLAGGDRASYHLSITDADIKKAEIEVINDRFEAKISNVFSFLACLLGAIPFFGFFYPPIRKSYATELSKNISLILPLLLSIILLLYEYFRSVPFFMSPLNFVQLRWLFLSAGFAFIIYLWNRQRQIQVIDRQIEELYPLRHSGKTDEPNLASVHDIVKRVESVTQMGSRKLRLIGWAAVMGLAIALLVYLVLSIVHPETEISKPVVHGTLEVIRL